ncbi:MAG: DUF616 domain-containing protein [Cyclobacteriaceae bacterium]|nr:DUF616 domain-containing protein [Cyclobacteriaceae bacterium]
MKSTIAIYTSIFGPYDGLVPQKKIAGIDYICFTNRAFRSRTWKIIPSEDSENNPVRSARKHKILAHRYLSDYKISVYMDGNFLVRKDPSTYINQLLKQSPMAVYDHSSVATDARDCLYQELSYLLTSNKTSGWSDQEIKIMKDQVERYKREGYPEKNGLIASGVLIRDHHDETVAEVMESWWQELSNGSTRDQLSFNYVAWKKGFQPACIQENIRDNDYFYMLGKHRADYTSKFLRYKLKSFFGLQRKY